MRRGGRARRTGEICRRRGQRRTGRRYDGLRQRMRRKAHRHGVKPRRHGVRNLRAAREHHRQRARPKFLREQQSLRRHVRTQPGQLADRRDMGDQRIVLRPALGDKDVSDRRFVEGVRREAVNRLRGNRHQSAAFENLRGGGGILLCQKLRFHKYTESFFYKNLS